MKSKLFLSKDKKLNDDQRYIEMKMLVLILYNKVIFYIYRFKKQLNKWSFEFKQYLWIYIIDSVKTALTIQKISLWSNINALIRI